MESKKADKGLYFLIAIAAYYGIPASGENIIHSMAMDGKRFESDDILRAAKLLKLKAKTIKISADKLCKMTLPAIIKCINGYALLLKADENRFLVLDEPEGKTKVITKDELNESWSGECILFIPRLMQNRDIKFGFKWFIPTILKYKAPLIEVLCAALVMQILSLLSPLITQSVIDKVLVHNSLSTLDVLAIGLILIAVFETILSVARNYIFTHTASKIDVILSCRLFDHLFRLPLRYFETRRVGDTVARIRELENIRRFLTGVPMTTVLDSLFIVVYIVVMLFYSPVLTLISLAAIPVLVLISVIITPVLKSRLDEKFNCGAESQSYLVEAVTGVQTIKSFAVEPSARKKWEGLLAKYTTASFKTSILSGNAGAVAQFVQKIADLLILWVGARLVIAGSLTAGQLVAFRMLSVAPSMWSFPLYMLESSVYSESAVIPERSMTVFISPSEAESIIVSLPKPL